MAKDNTKLFIASVITIVKETGLRQTTRVFHNSEDYFKWVNLLSSNKILAEGKNYKIIETEVCIYTVQFKSVDIVGMFLDKGGK